MKQHVLILTTSCALALFVHICVCAQEHEKRAAFYRVVDTWQKGPYGDGCLLSTQQVALLADVMYQTFTERGLTGAVVKALGEYRYPQGQEPWRPTNDTIQFTAQNVQAIIDSFVSIQLHARTSSLERAVGEYDRLLWLFGDEFMSHAFHHYLALCTNYALHEKMAPVNVLSMLAACIQKSGLGTADVAHIDAMFDVAEQVLEHMAARTNAAAAIERVHLLNLWPEDASCAGQTIGAAYLIGRIKKSSSAVVKTWLFRHLYWVETEEAYRYYADYGRPYVGNERDAYWKEQLRQYRERVRRAEERRKLDARERKGQDARAAVLKRYHSLLERVTALRHAPATARTAHDYWRVLKELDARRAEWEAAGTFFDTDMFLALATNYACAAARRTVYAEALNTENYLPAKRYIPMAAATVLGMVLEPDDIPALVKHVNKAKPMRLLLHEDDELTDAESGGRIDVFIAAIDAAVEHERRAALEALAAQVATLRDPWLREMVRNVLEQAQVTVPECAAPVKTDYFKME